MIYYHKHHILPKHMGGLNSPENIVILTVEEHALEHKKLFDLYGHEQDRIAWLALSGQITHQAATRKIISLSNQKRLENKTHHLLKGDIQRKAALDRIKSKTHNDEDLHISVKCPHCDKIGQKFVMKRWHFDKCKIK